jgi:hypothetical protein
MRSLDWEVLLTTNSLGSLVVDDGDGDGDLDAALRSGERERMHSEAAPRAGHAVRHERE